MLAQRNRCGLVPLASLVLLFLVATTAGAQQVQSLEHDPLNGRDNSLVQVDADTYALAYTGDTFDGSLKTFAISADGSTITQVQSLVHDTVNGQDNSLVQVDADTYALAYSGGVNVGVLKTFTISADGSTITQVQSLVHDTVRATGSSLVQVDADTYALAYTGDDFDGFLKTFTISADGSTITQVQTLEYDPLTGFSSSLVRVDADTYALAYGSLEGVLKTFTIPADGSTITEVQSLVHDPIQGVVNCLVQVDADTYALAYRGEDSDGFLKTFTISADGSTITEVQSLEHDTLNAQFNSLVQVDADTYALAYTGDGSDGFLKTFTISADGSTIAQVQSLEHEVDSGLDNSLVQVDADTYALAYAGVDSDGFLKTFTIDMGGALPVTLKSFSVD